MGEELLGPYRLDGLIGRGGMGEVHRAFDTAQHRSVALKLLPAHLASDHDFAHRFRRESQLVARLREPHIIPIHRFGEIDGRLFIDMRLVDGRDLGALLSERGAFPPERAVDIVSQVADALDAAHAEGLVHRDVKPSNVLVDRPDRRDGRDFVYLVDFGIARRVGATSLTALGTAVGTLDYIAPERFDGEPGDRRVDVYALGCLLFEMLTAAKPFRAGGLPALMHAHLHRPPPRASERRPGLPAVLDDVVVRAMAKQPQDRYASAGELAGAARAALDRFRAGGAVGTASATLPVTPLAPPPAASVAPPSPVRVPPRRAPRRIVLLAAGAAVTVVVVIAAVVALMRGATGTPSSGTATPSTDEPYGVVTTIPVGAGAGAVAISPDGRTVYVANTGVLIGPEPTAAPGAGITVTGRAPGSVSVIDTATDTVTATIPVPDGPGGVVVSPDGRRVYVATFGSALLVIDTATGTVARTVPVPGGGASVALAVARDGSRVYLTTDGTDSLTVIDTVAFAVVATIPVGDEPVGVALSPDGRRAYVPDHLADTVSVIDTGNDTVVAEVPVGATPSGGVAVAPDGSFVIVTSAESVTVLDTATDDVGATFRGGAWRVVIAPDGRFLYVVTADGVEISDLSGTRITTVALPLVQGGAVAPDGSRGYFTTGSDAVTVVRLDT